jgi:hypothetical protein
LTEPRIRIPEVTPLCVGLLDAQARIIFALGVGVKTSSLEANLRKSESPISFSWGLVVCE